MAGKVNPVQSYQEATNQLLQINAQRKNNLAEAKAEEMVEASRNNTLAQASEFVSSQPSVGGPVNATFNPATKNILGQYGLDKPKIQKTSSSSQQVTKQNIVINNKNTTITNNNVRVPANQGGPIQGRPIQFKDQNQIKFKSWLSNSFAQQNELAEKRKREYEKRDISLTKTANKLMRKLEETGKNIATNLNPKTMASSMGKQFKTLMMILGIGYLAKHWPEVLEKVTSIEKKVVEIKDKVVDFFSEGGGLVKMLGGKENESIFAALKNLFIGEGGILPYVRDWLKHRFEERSEAIKKIKKPDFSLLDIKGSISSIADYLSQILTAIMNPLSQGGATQVTNKSQESSSAYINKNWEKYSKDEYKGLKGVAEGDYAIMSGKFNGTVDYMKTADGGLSNSGMAAVAQSTELYKDIRLAEKGKVNTSAVASGFSRLTKAAEQFDTVNLSTRFVDENFTPEQIKEVGLRKEPGSYYYRPKSDAELLMDYARQENDDALMKKVVTGLSTAVGTTVAVGGTILSGGAGAALMAPVPALSAGLGAQLATEIDRARKSRIPKEKVVFVPSGSMVGKDWKPVPNSETDYTYWATKDQLQKLISIFTGQEGLTADVNNYDFVKAIENALVSRVSEKNKGNITKDIDIDNAYSVNRIMSENQQKDSEAFNNLRAVSGFNYTKDVASNVKNDVGNWFSNHFNFGGSNGTFKPDETYENIDAGDLGKRAAYVASHSSQFIGNGKARDLGRDNYKGLCTAGPATFYEQAGLNGIRHKFWEKGKSYHNSTTSGLKDIGFKMVWHGTKEQGHNTGTLKEAGYIPQPGDILLNFASGLKPTEKHPGGNSGHAQMWDGNEWVSDTRQGQRSWSYNFENSKGRLNNYSVQVWRYDSQGDYNPTESESSVSNTPEVVDEFTGVEDYTQEPSENNSAGGTIGGYSLNEYANIMNSYYTNPATSNYFGEEQKSSEITQSSEIPEFEGYASLPEVTVTSTSLPNPNQASYNNSVSSNDVSITPESSFSDTHSAVFSETSDGSGSNFTNKEDNIVIPNYTVSLNSISADLQTIRDLISLGNDLEAQGVDATSIVANAINNLKGNSASQIPYATDYTMFYDQRRSVT